MIGIKDIQGLGTFRERFGIEAILRKELHYLLSGSIGTYFSYFGAFNFTKLALDSDREQFLSNMILTVSIKLEY
ncbi:hypothetical protein BpHYR1_038782 [Brachionus plicatilis]|uniref:Uncharacterized protein n=1 Tax=Brachionus plicatilis TaxID=10195 RepID=A0A3M7SYX2_BRAPC|nr:hypothetical protein BpHYR1_038782 [Brachionus plicatilis]